jgi:gamma-glutamyltranspeptidase/glutathione hydrolase
MSQASHAMSQVYPTTTQARPPVYAPRGVVATSQPLAAAAGLAVLRRGGNAVDAAIATAVTLTVVQPGSNDIGSDLFAMVWDGTRLHGLNASGRSPAALELATARAAAVPATLALGGAQAAAGSAMPALGWLPVTVPGAPAGWSDLHQRFGRLPFSDLFTDAITYAVGGYPVSPRIAASWDRAARQHQVEPGGPECVEWPHVFTIGGRAPRAGELWRNPQAGQTLNLIAQSHAEAFYHGEIAQALARHAQATGGLITAADLAGHRNDWVEPIAVTYRGHEVWELPPNGQGVAALIALAILEGLDLAGAGVERQIHLQVEAVKLGFADAHACVADPATPSVGVAAMLEPGYLAVRRRLITEQAGDPTAGEPVRGGTVYLCTADEDGMMVSLIQSSYLGFGAHVVVPGYGFGLQNRGCGFSLQPGHPNAAGPAKRPYHTIIPGFLTEGGRAVGPFGVMGGHMQPQGHVQLIGATLDHGMDPQAALDAPRWYWHRRRDLYLESGLGPEVTACLRARGHQVIVEDSPRYGLGQAIWRRPGGGYVAGSDARGDSAALGY